MPLLGAQESDRSGSAWLSGFEAALEGGPFGYHSPLPDTRTALLVRANRAFPAIAWETAPVPADYSAEWVHFVWAFGIDANTDVRTFKLHVNGEPWLDFQNPATHDARDWTVHGAHGSSLRFRVTLVDRYQDLMGFASLRVPVDQIDKGRPLKLRVTGESKESFVWYMTFQRAIRPVATIEQVPAVIRKGQDHFQQVLVNLIHLGEPRKARILVEGQDEVRHTLAFGLNRIPLSFRPLAKPIPKDLRIEVAGEPAQQESFVLEPVREWTLYLVQHTHTDIGYTRPQTEILPEHLRFIDYALDYCDLTDSYPDDAQFRWTCESSWPVREYMKSRPASQIERLRQRVEQGRIEITAMMFNLSEIPDEPSLLALLEPLKRFEEAGLSVRTAMQNDVNGIAWCLADYFPRMGVEYLIMGQHSHRALASFKKPTAFWWESPSRSRVLGFRADIYATGNFWGLHTDNFESLEEAVFAYLDDLAGKDYPFDRISVQFGGYYTDNAPPSLAACELVRKWNDKYAWPRLRCATAQEFMDHVKENHGDDLPVFRAAWPDWWTDGFGSAARETAAARQTHVDLIAVQGLLALAAAHGYTLPEDHGRDLQEAYDALLFYDEHTFGAAESITDPLCENSMIQWGEKSAYAWEAVKRARLLRETALGVLQPHLPRADVPRIAVFNTLDWKRSGLHRLYIDHQILPPDRRFRILDEAGETVDAQLLSSRSDGSYWALWVKDVPAMGYKILRIERSNDPRTPPEKMSGTILENDYYRIEIDPRSGTLRLFVDKEQQLDLVDPGAEWGMLAFIYERLTDRHQLEQFKLEGFERTALKDIRLLGGEDGPVWKSLAFSGNSAGCRGPEGVRCEIRLYHRVKRIDFLFSIRKEGVTDPEGIYVAFPFALPGGRIAYEAQGGMVSPGVDQLPGSSSDWHTVQNFACLRNKGTRIVLGSNEVPLMHFGGINLGEFKYIASVKKPHIYSWVMNNYWVTNFRASQEGEFKWSYYMTSSRDPSLSAAARFGWGCRVPLVSRVLPPGTPMDSAMPDSLFSSDKPNLLLISARPLRGDQGAIFQWREVDGAAARLDLLALMKGMAVRRVEEVDPLGRTISILDGTAEFRPFEVKFIKVFFRSQER
jgi:hypothetical protein